MKESAPGIKRFAMLSMAERSGKPELMDGVELDQIELEANFRDIRRVNRLLGGTSIILKQLPRVIASVPAGQTISMLDLAAGSGDIPVAIADWARSHTASVAIVASDNNEVILEIARRHIAGRPEITLENYDARRVPLPDESFDVALCSLSLHHFDPDDAVRVLSEMDRLARHGFILNDLRRSRLAFVAAWIAAHLATRNRLTRNDAPLSVRRAYTPSELAGLLHRAGIDDATIVRRRWFRMAAVKIGAASNGRT